MKRSSLVARLLTVALFLSASPPLWAGVWIPESLGSLEEFQKAMKARDSAAMWALLTSDSQAAAEKAAANVAAAYEKAGTEEKAKIEAALGLKSPEVQKLDGKQLLLTRPFLDAYAYLLNKDRPQPGMVEGKGKISLTWKTKDKDDVVILRKGKDDTRYRFDLPMPKLP